MQILAAIASALVLLAPIVAAPRALQDTRPAATQPIVHDGKSLAEWTKALRDDNSATRVQAARALVAIGEPAFPALSEALADPYQPVWQNTVDSLVKIGDAAVPALLAVLRMEGSGDLRHNGGVAAFQQLGAAAHPALKRALDDKDPDVRLSAAVALRMQVMGRDNQPVIAILAEVLRKNSAVRVRMAAAESLGFSTLFVAGPAPQAAVDALLAGMSDANDDVRGMSAVGLVRLNRWQGHDVVPLLIQALQSKDPEGMLPMFAVEALGRLGPAAESAVPALTAIVNSKDSDSFLGSAAAEALGEIGPAAAPALRDTLSGADDSARARAASALGQAGADSADSIRQLLDAMKQDNPNVRAAAARGLGQARASSDDAVAALIHALADSNRDVRFAAIWAIGKIGSKAKAAVPALIALFPQLQDYERGALALALAAIGPDAKEAIPSIAALLPDGDIRTGEALARIGPASVPVLVGYLKHESSDARVAAAWGLRCLGADARDAVPGLTALVKADEESCVFAVQALGEIGPDAASAVAELVALLAHGDLRYQYCTLHALAALGPAAKDAKNAVLKAMETTDPELRGEAATALIRMGEVESALPVLEEAVRRGPDEFDPRTIELLGESGPRSAAALPLIAKLLQQESAPDYIRFLCAKAIGRIAPGDERGLVFLRAQVDQSDLGRAIMPALMLIELNAVNDSVVSKLKSGCESASPQMVILSAGGLARVESQRDFASHLLREKLAEKNTEIRIAAALALCSAGDADPEAVKILAGELRKDDGSGKQVESIDALAAIAAQSPAARAEIDEALHHEWEAVRIAARAAVRALPK